MMPSLRRVAAALAIAVTTLLMTSLLMTSVQADQVPVVSEYVVEPGDTLWDLAAGVTVAGSDVRATLADIREVNDLSSSMIQPGQILLLPAG